MTLGFLADVLISRQAAAAEVPYMGSTKFTIKKIIAAASMAICAAGTGAFAGAAAADPENCSGGIGPGSDHQPYEVGAAATAACVHEDDMSDTSMTDIDEAGSYPGHAAALTASPQTTVP
jgi:hypothetical protein